MNNIIIKNGIKYKQYKDKLRKLCIIENCNGISSGEYCRKHKIQDLKNDEKKCSRCLSIKNINEFKKDNTLYLLCYNCREYKRKQSLERHDTRRKFLLQIKIDMGGKCIDCEINDLEILEFDHITDNKLTEVRKISNYEGMLIESKKCVLRCCNCHSIKTKETVIKNKIDINNTADDVLYSRSYRKTIRDYVKNIKIESSGCNECGWYDINNLQVLQFDHIDNNNKEYTISRLCSSGCNLNILKSEIEKCQILCGNCHRKKTLRQFEYPILKLINLI